MEIQEALSGVLQEAEVLKAQLKELKAAYEHEIEFRIAEFCATYHMSIKNRLIEIFSGLGFTPQEDHALNDSILRSFDYDEPIYIERLYSGTFLNSEGESLYIGLLSSLGPQVIEIILCHDPKRVIPVSSGRVVVSNETEMINYITAWLNNSDRDEIEFQSMLRILKRTVGLIKGLEKGELRITKDWSYEYEIARKAILLGYATSTYEWIGPEVFFE
jgi:hypothetical protein